MDTLAVRKKMFYCPKCKRNYADDSQRFCNNDGGRLLPATKAGKKGSSQQKGVFTSLLGRTPSRFERDEKIGAKSRGTHVTDQRGRFEPPVKSKVFRSEQLLVPEISGGKRKESELSAPPGPTVREPKAVRPNAQANRPEEPYVRPLTPPVVSREPEMMRKSGAAIEKPVPETAKPIARLIDPREIASGRAPLGDRKVSPTGREAVSAKDPSALVGQVIKGRYRIIKTIRSDHASIAYLAEDSILKGQKVVVRVLMKNMGDGSLENKIFLEERVSLSHVNHPNVAKVIDSGELPEGKAFIVTSERRDNSVGTLIRNSVDLNPMRVARIVRQSSYALSEVHQNGILHRNLKPEDILLTVSEAGIEQVKVTDFCVSDGSVTADNFRYKAPEQIGGQLPTFSSDSYTLAVIAYRLMTKRFPFEGDTEREVLAAQRAGLTAKPSELNRRLAAGVDQIFVRALAYEPSKRYPKARDFGEVLFAALTDEAGAGEFRHPDSASEGESPFVKTHAVNEDKIDPPISVLPESGTFDSDIRIESTKPSIPASDTQADVEVIADEVEKHGAKETLWQNRSPEPTNERGIIWTVLSLAGLLVLVVGVIGVWSYFFRNAQVASEPDVSVGVPSGNQTQGVDDKASNLAKVPESSIETPPPPRQVQAPRNAIYFENSKSKLSEKLAKSFHGFSLYYPERWKRKLVDKEGKKVDDKFLDIAISDKNGVPIEHFMVSPYVSNGTFKTDTELFTKLVEKSNKDIAASLEGFSYKVVAEGATTIQGGRWKAYEVNFELAGEGENGKPFYIWGRRLWIPVQRPGAKNGFILTMLATSLSKDVKRADDVGKQGDLRQIVQTFEPVQEF